MYNPLIKLNVVGLLHSLPSTYLKQPGREMYTALSFMMQTWYKIKACTKDAFWRMIMIVDVINLFTWFTNRKLIFDGVSKIGKRCEHLTLARKTQRMRRRWPLEWFCFQNVSKEIWCTREKFHQKPIKHSLIKQKISIIEFLIISAISNNVRPLSWARSKLSAKHLDIEKPLL